MKSWQKDTLQSIVWTVVLFNDFYNDISSPSICLYYPAFLK